MKTRPAPNTAPPTDLEVALVPAETYVQMHQPPGFTHAGVTERHLGHAPGGRTAVAQGCTCPQIHDRRGYVTLLIDGHPMMLIRKGCPFHTPPGHAPIEGGAGHGKEGAHGRQKESR